MRGWLFIGRSGEAKLAMRRSSVLLLLVVGVRGPGHCHSFDDVKVSVSRPKCVLSAAVELLTSYGILDCDMLRLSNNFQSQWRDDVFYDQNHCKFTGKTFEVASSS
jgi:hypothetical protein